MAGLSPCLRIYIAFSLLSLHAYAKRQHIAPFAPRIPSHFHTPSHLHARDAVPSRPVDPVDIATEFVLKKLNIPKTDLRRTDAYESRNTGVWHVYFVQTMDGVDVDNADINVNVWRGSVLSYGSNTNGFVGWKMETEDGAQPHQDEVRPTLRRRTVDVTPSMSAEEALRAFLVYLHLPSATQPFSPTPLIPLSALHRASSTPPPPNTLIFHVSGAVRPVQVRKKYLRTSVSVARLTWEIRLDLGENWYHAHVDAETGDVLQLNDWISDLIHAPTASSIQPLKQDSVPKPPQLPMPLKKLSSEASNVDVRRPVPSWYRVVPLSTNDPSRGPRILLTETKERDATPYGWRGNPYPSQAAAYPGTQGNNVHAQRGTGNWTDYHVAPRPAATIWGMILDPEYDASWQDPTQGVDAGIVNAFYWVNWMHDFTWHLGFTGPAGAFQDVNFDGGDGRVEDAVLVNVQSPDGMNNANFASPPDGERGRLRLYLFKGTDGKVRDSALENDIIFHEYSHGMSNRLTGGPSKPGCLVYDEHGGLGEGYGDFFAIMLRLNETSTRENVRKGIGFGEWVTGKKEGLRRYMYSWDGSVHPETYSWLDKPDYLDVHFSGPVWTAALYDVFWSLREFLSFTNHWSSASLGHSNTLMMRLVSLGMQLQPCRPTFIIARDAILQAEKVLTGGKWECVLWKGFAGRGLGAGAALNVDEDGIPLNRIESFQLPEKCLKK